jgi:hypothetical protein
MKVRRFNENRNNFDDEAKYILESLEDFMPNDDSDNYYYGIDKYYFSENFKNSIRVSEYNQSIRFTKAIYTKIGYILIGTINLVDTIESSQSSTVANCDIITITKLLSFF